MMKKATKRLFMLLATILVVSLLAACTQGPASTSSSNPSSSSSSASTSTVSWPKTIKFAYMGPMTGNYSLYGTEYSHAVEMMFEKINESGGIKSMGGAKLEFEVYDDKNDAKESVIVANKIIGDSNVVACLGPFSTSNGLAVKPIFNEAKMPLISTSISNPTFAADLDYCFSSAATQPDQMKTYGEFMAKDLGYKKCAVLWANSEWGKSVYDALEKYFTGAGGEIVYQENYEIGTKDFRPQLAKYKNYDFDFFYLAGHIAECGPVVNQIAELKFNKPILTSNSLLMTEFIDVVKENGEGIIMLSYFSPGTDNPAAFEEFRTEYLDRYTDIKSVDVHVFAMGDMINALQVILEKIGSEGKATTVPQLREAITKMIPTLTYKGMISDYKFTPEGQAQKPMVPCVLKDGKFALWQK